jgi:hypothetical protein
VRAAIGNITSTTTESSARALGHRLRTRLEAVHAADHRFRLDQQRLAFAGQLRVLGRAVEEIHPQLALEFRDSVADERLGAPQLAPRRREAAGLRRRDEHPQLVEGKGVNHLSN